jgi:hypothetical protein
MAYIIAQEGVGVGSPEVRRKRGDDPGTVKTGVGIDENFFAGGSPELVGAF